MDFNCSINQSLSQQPFRQTLSHIRVEEFTQNIMIHIYNVW